MKSFSTRRAVLISGGITSQQNHSRYLNDLTTFYCCLVDYYGFKQSDIRVVYNNDGLHDLGWRTSPVATKIATSQNAQDAIEDALKGLTDEDLFVLYTTNHGHDVTRRLELWRGEHLTCGKLEELLKTNTEPYRLGVFGHCYSRTMADTFVNAPDDHKGVAVSASDVQSSSLPPDDMYDAFVYHFTAALQEETPSGHPVPSDANTDTYVDIDEAFKFVDQLKSYKNLRTGGLSKDDPRLHDNVTGDLAKRLTLKGLI